MNQSILITGGSGLLGAYLVRWFKHKGFKNITATYQYSKEAIPVDILEGVRWEPLVLPDKAGAHQIVHGQDWVIHAAGLVSYKKKDRYRLLEVNQVGTEHIVNASLAHGIAHLVYIGSIGALGRENDHVALHETSPWLQNRFSTSYGLSKYLGELEVWRGAAEGLNVSVILPSVILGSGNGNRSSLKILNRVLHKSVWYPGGQTGFVDVRDVTAFAGLLLEKSHIGGRWLLCGANLTYEDLYRKIAFYAGVQKKFRRAPKILARMILSGGNLLDAGGLGMEVLHQVYGTFVYDGSGSESLTGFTYRNIDTTIREVVEAYQAGVRERVLPFM